MSMDRVVASRRTVLSPWVTLAEQDVLGSAGPETYHAFAVADYVNVLAVDDSGRIPLVRQFRPALNATLLELPGGMLDVDETPQEAAARELYEEAGVRCAQSVMQVGVAFPDPGRLINRLWSFTAVGVSLDEAWQPESGIEVIWLSPAEFRTAIIEGTFTTATGLCVLAQALVARALPPAVHAALGGGR